MKMVEWKRGAKLPDYRTPALQTLPRRSLSETFGDPLPSTGRDAYHYDVGFGDDHRINHEMAVAEPTEELNRAQWGGNRYPHDTDYHRQGGGKYWDLTDAAGGAIDCRFMG